MNKNEFKCSGIKELHSVTGASLFGKNVCTIIISSFLPPFCDEKIVELYRRSHQGVTRWE
jgi:hypothetical protein